MGEGVGEGDQEQIAADRERPVNPTCGNTATLSNNLGGLIFGADATLQGRYRLGVAGGYDYSTLGLGARGSSGNVSTTYVGLYGGLSDGALQLRGGGFYGYNHYGTNRTAVFPGFADTLGSGYGGDTWQAFAEAGFEVVGASAPIRGEVQ